MFFQSALICKKKETLQFNVMAIIVNLDVVMAKRKMSLTELSQKIDITLANLSILKTGKAKAIRFSTLNDICRILDCQPADILEHQPERRKAKTGASAALVVA